MKNKKVTIPIIAILLIAGIAFLLYPTVSNWLFNHRSVNTIKSYDKEINNMSQQVREAEWKKAKEYNKSLNKIAVGKSLVPGSGVILPENYSDVLNIGGRGMMGIVEIPKIKVSLPIYHGLSDKVLLKGVGHIEGTSLPIGEKGTHSFLTAHTGLPSAKLFSDLEDLVIDDIFIIRIMNKKMTYRVNNISVVPADEKLVFSPDKNLDYVTLLTCTPNGVNSHRLLVQGMRIFPQNELPIVEEDDNLCVLFWIIIINALLLITISLYRHYKRKMNQSNL